MPDIRNRDTIAFPNNSLNLIRLLAAVSVMYFHATHHMGIERIPVLSYFLSYFYAVPFFFMLSGYLTWHSLRRAPGFWAYFKKRCVRIFPAVWASILLGIVLLLMIYQQKIQWLWTAVFFAAQALLLPFFLPDSLRGYGSGTPNGSLWTLGHQMQFYIFVFFAYPCLHHEKKRKWLILLAGSVLIAMLLPTVKQNVPEFIGKVYETVAVNYLWLFVIGAFVSEYKDILLKIFVKYWWLFAVLSIAVMLSGFDFKVGSYGFLRSVTLFPAALGFAYRFPGLRLKTDISFGIYLYHMVIVNAMIELGFTGERRYLVIVIFISCVLALLSEKGMAYLNQVLKRQNMDCCEKVEA